MKMLCEMAGVALTMTFESGFTAHIEISSIHY